MRRRSAGQFWRRGGGARRSFEIAHLHLKSGSLSPLKRFAFELRDIVRRQPLPGYRLAMERSLSGRELLTFKPIDIDPAAHLLGKLAPPTSPEDNL